MHHLEFLLYMLETRILKDLNKLNQGKQIRSILIESLIYQHSLKLKGKHPIQANQTAWRPTYYIVLNALRPNKPYMFKKDTPDKTPADNAFTSILYNYNRSHNYKTSAIKRQEIVLQFFEGFLKFTHSKSTIHRSHCIRYPQHTNWCEKVDRQSGLEQS